MKRERWQTKSDGEGASAAEAKWLGKMSVSEILTIGDKKCKAKRSSDLLPPSVSARFLLAEPPSPKETARR
ncbi:MAG: hypothetical protein PUH93_01420 [Clostridia bacterium]|nr:hypothetical protein [Clostridia bacterium]